MSQIQTTEVSDKKFYSNILIAITGILINPVAVSYLIRDNLKALGKDKVGQRFFIASIILFFAEVIFTGVLKSKGLPLSVASSLNIPINAFFINILSYFVNKEEKALINNSKKRPSIVKPLLSGILLSIIITIIIGLLIKSIFHI